MIYRVLAERDRGALKDRMTGGITDLGSVGAEGELRRGQETEWPSGSLLLIPALVLPLVPRERKGSVGGAEKVGVSVSRKIGQASCWEKMSPG